MEFESDDARTRGIEFVPKSERTLGRFELKLEGPEIDESEEENRTKCWVQHESELTYWQMVL